MISVACGVLALAFLVFTLFALSTGAVALGLVTGVLFLAVAAVWIWALVSMKKEEGDSPLPADQAEAVAVTFSRLKPKSFRAQIRTCQKQLARLQEKTEAMDATLHEAFGDSTISIDKFMAGIRNARRQFLDNQKQIADRILIFDDEGYRAAAAKGSVPAAYQDTFSFIDRKIEENETILTRIDELNARVQAIKNTPQLEDRSAMRQLDDLIRQSGLYVKTQEKEK